MLIQLKILPLYWKKENFVQVPVQTGIVWLLFPTRTKLNTTYCKLITFEFHFSTFCSRISPCNQV